ncbi:hypothetical protein ACFL44_01070, partial [Gemmatimonadota bacterium]
VISFLSAAMPSKRPPKKRTAATAIDCHSSGPHMKDHGLANHHKTVDTGTNLPFTERVGRDGNGLTDEACGFPLRGGSRFTLAT